MKTPEKPKRLCAGCDHYEACQWHSHTGVLHEPNANRCGLYSDRTHDRNRIAVLEQVVEEGNMQIEQLESQLPRWISVEESPPVWPCVVYDGHNRPYTPRGCIAMLEDKDGNHEWIPDYPLEALLQGKRAEMHNLPVTHWMPLPEPPKEDAP